MTRSPFRSLTSLLLLSVACSSAPSGLLTESDGTAGEGAGGSTASAGSAPVAAAGTSPSAAGSGSGGQSGSAGGASSGASGTLGGAGAFGGGGTNSGGAGGRAGNGGAAGSGSGGASAGAGGSSCPGAGHITYTLAQAASPTATEQDAYKRIKAAMDKAISYYDCYTNITKSLKVSFVPSVDTADGNINGSLRFGSKIYYMDYRTAMHEIGHTVGIGQASNWNSFRTTGNLFTGAHAAAQLKAINATLSKPLDTQVHADPQHFWPYGINQQEEVNGEADLIAHCQMVAAIREDLGLK